MTVYIVLKNGKIDCVFSDRISAEAHAKCINKKWSITDIIEKEVIQLC